MHRKCLRAIRVNLIIAFFGRFPFFGSNAFVFVALDPIAVYFFAHLIIAICFILFLFEGLCSFAGSIKPRHLIATLMLSKAIRAKLLLFHAISLMLLHLALASIYMAAAFSENYCFSERFTYLLLN